MPGSGLDVSDNGATVDVVGIGGYNVLPQVVHTFVDIAYGNELLHQGQEIICMDSIPFAL